MTREEEIDHEIWRILRVQDDLIRRAGRLEGALAVLAVLARPKPDLTGAERKPTLGR